MQVRLSCLETLAMIGQYHITPEELSALLRHSTPTVAADEACCLTPPRARWLSSGEDVPAQLEEEEEVRNGLLQAIAAVSQRSCPKYFFHSNGQAGWIRVAPIIKFPSAKVGYSLSCWIRVSNFVGEESTFVRWLQQDGEQMLELTFQKLGAAADTARCLSVRTHSGRCQAKSQPVFLNVFNAQSFAADGMWHHMVFTHLQVCVCVSFSLSALRVRECLCLCLCSRVCVYACGHACVRSSGGKRGKELNVLAYWQRTLGLWIDGQFVQSCTFTTYVSPPGGVTSKEHSITCYFGGGGGEGESGGIRGDFSSLLLTEGVWDARTVASQFALGPLHDITHTKQVRSADTSKDKVSDHKTVLVVSPSSCFKGRHHVSQNSLVSGSNALSDMAGTLLDRFSKMRQFGGGGAEDKDAGGNTQLAIVNRSPRASGKDKDKDAKKSGKLGEDLGDQPRGELGAWLNMHATQTLHESLRQVGGIALLLRLLVPGPEGSNEAFSQVLSLRVLAQVLRTGHEEEVAEFMRLRGECVLLYVLSQCDTAEEQVFDVLLQMACGSEAMGIKHSPFVVLAMYLLQLSSLDVRGKQKVLRWIDDRFLTAGNAGRQVWMATEELGLRVLLNLARRSDVALNPTVVALAQQTAPSWGYAELEELLNFILGISTHVCVLCEIRINGRLLAELLRAPPNSVQL